MKGETIGAIDIGSNAIRLLVSVVDENNAAADFKRAAFLRVPIRLGEDVFTIGRIGKQKEQLLTEALTGFSYLMRVYGVSRYRAFATSAMRDAANGSEIVSAIREKCGINIEIIDGLTESEIIFEAGGLSQFMNRVSNAIYVDVGGGSTEIILYCNGEKIRQESFRIGTVRMLEGAVEESEQERFKKYLKAIYKEYYPLSIIGSGGNINKIYKVLGAPESHLILYPEFKVLYDSLTSMSLDERVLNYKLKNNRADVIVPAMKIFLTVCKHCKVNEIFVPKLGLADGIIRHIFFNERGA